MISVIIPAYNAATFIADCLDSLIAQDFTDWEAVVVDDGSTDSTPLLAESYAARDRRIRLARRPNGG
ncbi:MAG: glycosyltransferase, partial [Duncaniella sp.]|nr:glycosyltransferase [Duncaniella sp.]